MKSLLTLSYWFNMRAIPFVPAVERAFLVFFAVWTVAGIAAYLFLLKKGLSKITKRALIKLANLLTWSGLVGLLFWMFTYQGVPVLSMRFYFVLWGIWVILGFYFIYRYLYIEVPGKQKMHQERIDREKWLPKKKK